MVEFAKYDNNDDSVTMQPLANNVNLMIFLVMFSHYQKSCSSILSDKLGIIFLSSVWIASTSSVPRTYNKIIIEMVSLNSSLPTVPCTLPEMV